MAEDVPVSSVPSTAPTRSEQSMSPPKDPVTPRQGYLPPTCVSSVHAATATHVRNDLSTALEVSGQGRHAPPGPFSPISPVDRASAHSLQHQTIAPHSGATPVAGDYGTYTSSMQLPVQSPSINGDTRITARDAARSFTGGNDQGVGPAPHPPGPRSSAVEHQVPAAPRVSTAPIEPGAQQVYRTGPTVQVNIQPGVQNDTVIMVAYPSSSSSQQRSQNAPVYDGGSIGGYSHPQPPGPMGEPVQGPQFRQFSMPPSIPTPSIVEYTHPPEPTPPVPTPTFPDAQFEPLKPLPSRLQESANQAAMPASRASPLESDEQPTTPAKPKRRRGPRKKKLAPADTSVDSPDLSALDVLTSTPKSAEKRTPAKRSKVDPPSVDTEESGVDTRDSSPIATPSKKAGRPKKPKEEKAKRVRFVLFSSVDYLKGTIPC